MEFPQNLFFYRQVARWATVMSSTLHPFSEVSYEIPRMRKLHLPTHTSLIFFGIIFTSDTGKTHGGIEEWDAYMNFRESCDLFSVSGLSPIYNQCCEWPFSSRFWYAVLGHSSRPRWLIVCFHGRILWPTISSNFFRKYHLIAPKQVQYQRITIRWGPLEDKYHIGLVCVCVCMCVCVCLCVHCLL